MDATEAMHGGYVQKKEGEKPEVTKDVGVFEARLRQNLEAERINAEYEELLLKSDTTEEWRKVREEGGLEIMKKFPLRAFGLQVAMKKPDREVPA